MYFKSRTEAGIILAEKIVPKYWDKKCSVLALGDGGVLVATQIALRLRCALMLLLTEPINLPREPEAIASVNQDGGFTYNSAYSDGEISDIKDEYRNYIDLEKQSKTHEIHVAMGDGTLVKKSLLKHKYIILVSDGIYGTFALDSATEFLKPIESKGIIVATPMANIHAVDRMHIMADEIYCLNVIEDYMSTEHYYEVNDVPDHEIIIETVQNVLDKWPR
jgi:putative phosphoribosyl transferase